MFDTHAHLFDPRLAPGLESLLERLAADRVAGTLCICDTVENAEAFRAVAPRYPFLRCAAGIHPHQAAGFSTETLEQLVAILQPSGRLQAIGETGLDFHYRFSPRETQIRAFKAHIELAATHRLPLVIHSRAAADDVLAILRHCPPHRAVIHCFSDGVQDARRFVELGCFLGVSGIITFPKADTLRAAVCAVPRDRLLIETDCPYLAPVPHRGQTNSPLLLPHTLAALARALGEDPVTLDRVLDANAFEVFGR